MNEEREDAVRFESDDHVARITLDRPDRHNALEAADLARVLELLDRVDADRSVRVLLLTGAGERTFCSGASLDQMQTGEMSGARFDTMTDRLASLRPLTVCALNGNVYGGGAELALCCDFRIGVAGMRLSVPAARLGVCYPVGGLTRYVRRLGPGPANRILLAAEEMEGPELLRLGFLSHLVPRERFAEEVERFVERLRSLAPLAVQGMKEIMGAVAENAIDRERALAVIERCDASDDLAEGLAAWRDRRAPEFEGR